MITLHLQNCFSLNHFRRGWGEEKIMQRRKWSVEVRSRWGAECSFSSPRTVGGKIWSHPTNEAPPCGPLAAARGCCRCDAVQNHSVRICVRHWMSNYFSLHVYLICRMRCRRAGSDFCSHLSQQRLQFPLTTCLYPNVCYKGNVWSGHMFISEWVHCAWFCVCIHIILL